MLSWAIDSLSFSQILCSAHIVIASDMAVTSEWITHWFCDQVWSSGGCSCRLSWGEIIWQGLSLSRSTIWSFPFPRLVSISMSKHPVCPTTSWRENSWIYTFLKMQTASFRIWTQAGKFTSYNDYHKLLLE